MEMIIYAHPARMIEIHILNGKDIIEETSCFCGTVILIASKLYREYNPKKVYIAGPEDYIDNIQEKLVDALGVEVERIEND